MSKLYEALCQSEKANPPVQRSGDDSLPSDGGRHRMDLRGPHLEETVKLVQRVFIFPNSHAPQVVVFSSVDEDDSSSEICSRVGQVLATQVSGSVCLVDANLLKPSLHRLLGVSKLRGLADAAVQPGRIKDFAIRIASGNLWLVPTGSSAGEVQGLFASDQLRSRMLELSKAFDYVLINAPSARSSADAVLLGQTAEGVILVVEANSTRRESARIAKETFERAKVRLLGAVLNNRTFPIPEALYQKL